MCRFRVWDKRKRKMYYDEFLMGTDGELYRIIDMYENQDNSYECNLIAVNQENYDIMKCLSNRKDLDNNDIYAKDIIRFESGTELCIESGPNAVFYRDKNDKGSNDGFVATWYDPVEGPFKIVAFPLVDKEISAVVVGNLIEGYYEK